MQTFSRVELLIGKENLSKLQGSHVAVFGIGGVGGIAVESLVRSGVGEITVIDNDVVAESNLNRQIISTKKVVNRKKTEVIRERLLSINPNLKFNAYNLFYLPETESAVDFSTFDYVIDAVDTVSAKLLIIEKAVSLNIPVISCMGTGGKLDPKKLSVDKIEKTSVCPLARVMRRELKKRNIKGIKVCYSTEETIEGIKVIDSENKKVIQPSMTFVPSVAGLLIANEVIVDLIKNKT